MRLPHQFPRRPCRSLGDYAGRPDAYIDQVCLPALKTRRMTRDLGRRGGRVLRGHRLRHRTDRAGFSSVPATSACRSSCMPRQLSNTGRHAAGGGFRRAIASGPSGTCHRRRCRRDGRRGLRGGDPAGGVLHVARNPKARRNRGLPRPWRADGRGGRTAESRLFAAEFDPAGHEHGRHAVPHDPRRVPRRGHPPRGARARARRCEECCAPAPRADLAIWNVDPPGGAFLPDRLQPACGSVSSGARCDRSSDARRHDPRHAGDAVARGPGRRARARGRAPRSDAAAALVAQAAAGDVARLTGSTQASASWPRCGCRPRIPRGCKKEPRPVALLRRGRRARRTRRRG